MAKEVQLGFKPNEQKVEQVAAEAEPVETVEDLFEEIQKHLLRSIRDAASPSGYGVDVLFAGQAADVYNKLFKGN